MSSKLTITHSGIEVGEVGCSLIFDFDVNSRLLGGNSPTSFVAFPAHFVILPNPWQLGLGPFRLPEYFLLPSSVARNNPRFGIEVSSFPQFVFVLSAELHPVKYNKGRSILVPQNPAPQSPALQSPALQSPAP